MSWTPGFTVPYPSPPEDEAPSAGPGSGSGSTPSTLPVPVEEGGTASTTALDALDTLGVISAITDAIAVATAAIINGAPSGGDTLNELHARLAVIEALGSLATDAELIALTASLLGSADADGDTLGELQALINNRLLKANNLSDLTNVGNALTNLGFSTFFKTLIDDPDAPTVRGTIGAAAATSVASVANLLPSSDTYISSGSPSSNADASGSLIAADDWGSGSFAYRALLTFDISSLAGKTLQRADLRLVTQSYGDVTGVHSIQARKIRRAYNPSQVTWNNYSTGNAWTTAGAKSTTTDIYPEYYGNAVLTTSKLAPAEVILDIRTMVQDAIDAAETTLRLIVGPEETDNQNSVVFHSLESATAAYRPRLFAVG